MKVTPPESVVLLGAGGLANIMHAHLKVAWPDTAIAVVDEYIKHDAITLGDEEYPICKDWDLSEARKSGHAFRHFLLAVTEPRYKVSFVEKALAHGLEPAPSLVHPSVIFDGDDISVGKCCFFVAGSIVHPAATIDDYVTVATHAVVGHHSRIGKYCTLNPGSIALGFVTMGDGSQLGAGTMVRGYINIAPGVTTGMQAAVTKDLDQDGGVYVGVPAKLLPPKNADR